MPRYDLTGASLPVTISAPGSLRRWYVTGFLIQGTGDGVVKVSGGNGSGSAAETMLSVTTTSGGGGALAGSQDTNIGTAGDNVELIISSTGSPGTLSGYIDYCWR